MNILILNWKDVKHPSVGGAEIIIFELAKKLVVGGHHVTWFCMAYSGCSSTDSYDGISIVRRGNLFTMYILAPAYYWSSQIKPDIILDASNTIFWQTPLWAWKSKKIAYLNQLAKEVFYYEYPPLIRHFGLLAERLQYLTYKSTPFICYSKSTTDDLISSGIPPQNIRSFSLGIDHQRYVPGSKSTHPLFLCVSRLVKMKRTSLVIKAMSEVIKAVPEAKLIIVGYGYERKSLERLRDRLRLTEVVRFADENILFFDKNTNDQKVKYMQQAWALVFPSVKEGWGMTVTECAACGTPAIVTDVSGLRDSVVADKTGLIVSSNPSPLELALAMIRIASDVKLRRRLSQNALKRARIFTWEKSYDNFKQLL